VSGLIKNGQPKIHAVDTKIHSPDCRHRYSGKRSNEYVKRVHTHDSGRHGKTSECKANYPRRRNALHLFFENSEIYTLGTDILANLYYGTLHSDMFALGTGDDDDDNDDDQKPSKFF
jgi:hypothetical protein